MVSYFESQNSYAVVWRGDNLYDGEFEIYWQLINELTQERKETKDVRLSHAGPDNSIIYDARRTSLVANNTNQSIQVIWEQEHESVDQTVGEIEIFSSSITVDDDIIFLSRFE